MLSASPPVLAIEGDSAWIVILAVSLVTLGAVGLLRRLIRRPGGLASGVLLSLPLLLPLVAAVSFDHAAFPVVALLRPADPTLFRESTGFLHLLFLADEGGRVVSAYTLSVMAGAWMLWIGVAASSVMLVRRAIGTMLVHRLIARSRPLSEAEARVEAMVADLCRAGRIDPRPRALVMPEGTSGAFAVAGRGGRILISPELIDQLDSEELEGILAHELAHLEAKDVVVTFTAGVLRDLVAWNPFGHLAFRRLLADREVEADRRAAILTGNPLAVASGLVRLCELKRKNRVRRNGFALAFGGGRVSRRVSNLLALADGRTHVRAGGGTPYIVAVALVAALGLHAGARIAAQGPGAFAITWGAVEQPTSGFWSPPARAADKGDRVEAKLQRGVLKRNSGDGVAFKAKFKSDFTRHMQRVARRAGLAHELRLWDLQRLQVFSGISIYRLVRLVPGPI